MNELSALADKYALSNKALSVMLSRGERTISLYRTGKVPVPADRLDRLRKIVAAIDAAM